MVGGGGAGFALAVSGDFKYGRAGTVAVVASGKAAGDELHLEASGLRKLATLGLSPAASWVPANSSRPGIALELAAGAAGITTAGSTTDLATLQAKTTVARVAAAFAAGSAELAEAGGGMQAGLMWNVLYDPTQLGPFVEVSRSFATEPYELFEWDTYFGAAMLAWDTAGLPLAVSSLVQVTKGKTLGPLLDGHGFVPGYSKGGRWLSEDRTERPVGALVTLAIWRKLAAAEGKAAARWAIMAYSCNPYG